MVASRRRSAAPAKSMLTCWVLMPNVPWTPWKGKRVDTPESVQKRQSLSEQLAEVTERRGGGVPRASAGARRPSTSWTHPCVEASWFCGTGLGADH